MGINRLLSAFVAVAWVATVITVHIVQKNGVKLEWIPLLGATVAALILIWFGDELGEFTGMTGRGYISQQSPGWMVKLFGWLLLLAMIGFWAYDLSTK